MLPNTAGRRAEQALVHHDVQQWACQRPALLSAGPLGAAAIVPRLRHGAAAQHTAGLRTGRAQPAAAAQRAAGAALLLHLQCYVLTCVFAEGIDSQMRLTCMRMQSALEHERCLALLSAICFHKSYLECVAAGQICIRCAMHCLGSGSSACWRRCHVTARVGASAPHVNGSATGLARGVRSCCASGHISLCTLCSAAPRSAPGPLAPSLGQPSDRIAPPAGRRRAPRLDGVDGHAVWLAAAHHRACR